jgi:hypothetical protein
MGDRAGQAGHRALPGVRLQVRDRLRGGHAVDGSNKGFGDGYINFGPPFYPLWFILRDATGPDGEYIGNFGRPTSVIVDYPFITGRSTPDSYATGQKLVEVLEHGLRRYGW